MRYKTHTMARDGVSKLPRQSGHIYMTFPETRMHGHAALFIYNRNLVCVDIFMKVTILGIYPVTPSIILITRVYPCILIESFNEISINNSSSNDNWA